MSASSPKVSALVTKIDITQQQRGASLNYMSEMQLLIQTLEKQLAEQEKIRKLNEELKKEYAANCQLNKENIERQRNKTAKERNEFLQEFQKAFASLKEMVESNSKKIIEAARKNKSINNQIVSHLAEIYSLSGILVIAASAWFSKTQNIDENLIYYYFFILKQFNDNKKKIDELINKLPKQSVLKAKVRKAVDEERNKFQLLLKSLEKILKCEYGIFDDFLKYIPLDWSREIDTKGDIINLELISINKNYFEEIKKRISEERQKFIDNYPLKAINKEGVVDGTILDRIDKFIKAIYGKLENPEPDHSRFSRFKLIFIAFDYCKNVIRDITQDAKIMMEILKNKKYQTKECQNAAMQTLKEETATEKSVSFEEVRQLEKRRLYEIEQEKRAAAQEVELEKKRTEFLLKKYKESEEKVKLEKEQIKKTILEGIKKIPKDELELLKKIWNGEDLHRRISESSFEQLAINLKLPVRKNDDGGKVVTIHTVTVNYHHWHGDRTGTLDGNVFKNFKKGLEELGITQSDLICFESQKKNSV